MTAEKHNINYNVGNNKKLSAYDRAIRSQKVRKPRYFDDAVKYIQSTQFDQDVKDALVKKLSSYPSNVIDKIFNNIDRMLIETEIRLQNQQYGIMERVKKIAEKPVVDLDALYDSDDDLQRTNAMPPSIPPVEEPPAEEPDRKTIMPPSIPPVEEPPVEGEETEKQFVPDPKQDEF